MKWIGGNKMPLCDANFAPYFTSIESEQYYSKYLSCKWAKFGINPTLNLLTTTVINIHVLIFKHLHYLVLFKILCHLLTQRPILYMFCMGRWSSFHIVHFISSTTILDSYSEKKLLYNLKMCKCIITLDLTSDLIKVLKIASLPLFQLLPTFHEKILLKHLCKKINCILCISCLTIIRNIL